jgi:hypothetical protein
VAVHPSTGPDPAAGTTRWRLRRPGPRWRQPPGGG